MEQPRDAGGQQLDQARVGPTRPRRCPREDNAKVEPCVLRVERWLIGRLRDRPFLSLAELNAPIGELIKRLNEKRPIGRLGATAASCLKNSIGRRPLGPHVRAHVPLPAVLGAALLQPASLARQRLHEESIDFRQRANAFMDCAKPRRLQQLADE
jgi:hypothetical protein